MIPITNMTTSTQNKHWERLGIVSQPEQAAITFILLQTMEEAGCLQTPTRTRTAQTKQELLQALEDGMFEMPLSIKELWINDHDYCIESLLHLALAAKNNSALRYTYYAQTSSRLLRNADVYIKTVDKKTAGPFALSKFLSDRRGLYTDGSVDERLLDYTRFLKTLVRYGFDPSSQRLGLWCVESDAVEVNEVFDHSSWVSAMIETQNVLQSTPGSFEFCVYGGVGPAPVSESDTHDSDFQIEVSHNPSVFTLEFIASRALHADN